MIQGNQYAYEDIQIIIPGRLTPINATEISYETTREHTNIYARGKDPVAMGRGKKEYKGSITVLQSELEALQRTLPPGQDLTDMVAFEIPIVYSPDLDIIPVTTDMLRYVRFTSVPKGGKVGDDHMPVQLGLAIGKIDYNV